MEQTPQVKASERGGGKRFTEHLPVAGEPEECLERSAARHIAIIHLTKGGREFAKQRGGDGGFSSQLSQHPPRGFGPEELTGALPGTPRNLKGGEVRGADDLRQDGCFLFPGSHEWKSAELFRPPSARDLGVGVPGWI